MIFNTGFLRRFVFGLSIEGLDRFWKEFPGTETETRRWLRLSSNAFINGYNTGLEVGLSHILFSELQAFDVAFRGFAYEGAGMGMAMIDYTSLSNQNLFQQFVDRSPNYSSLPYIGAGFAIAVLKRDLNRSLSIMDPMQRWWAIDGYGFYNGVFHRKQSIEKQKVSRQITGYAQRAFDRGLGRSIWFLFSGDIDGIVQRLAAFPESRRADLWAGIGVASTYAGGVDRATLEKVKAAAGIYASYLPLGSSLAANARYQANNIVEHNNLACSVYCGMSAESAAKLTLAVEQEQLIDKQEPVFTPTPVFETYRETIRSQFMQVPLSV
jgi:enediyne biosynthesis protein E3